MKNYFLLMFLPLVILSCDSTEMDIDYNQIELSKIENVKKLKGEDQKVAFRLLNNETKAKLWQNKIEELINSGVFSSEQIELMDELKSLSTKYTYDSKSSKYNTILEDISAWSLRAQKKFTKIEYVNYFVLINSKTDGSGGGGVGDPSCDCSRDSNHCGTFWEEMDCLKQTCEDNSILGCGTLMAYDCDGLCDE